MKNLSLTHHPRSLAFSLIEMLMTVSILSILTAIAIAFYSGADGVKQAKDQHNAHSFCTLCSTADAAGVRIIRDGVSKIEVLRELRTGVTAESGPFKGQTFRLPGVADEDIAAAANYLQIRDGQMIYQPMGVPTDG